MSRARARRAPRRTLLVALGLAGAGALALPAAGLGQSPAERAAILDASAAWRDVLEAHRAPVWPRPGDTETAIVLLDAPAVGDVPAAGRADALAAVRDEQQELVAVLGDLGATVTLRLRVAANAVVVRVPAGGVEAIARLPAVRTIVPVGYLAPAQAGAGDGDAPVPPPGEAARPAPAPAAGDAAAGPSVRIALIDAGIDPSHPALGGGMGATFPILGGVDLVDRDADPRIDASGVRAEAHGTQMAGILLGSPALMELPPERRPRLVVHRVVDVEAVDGRMRPLARTDRVLGALERALDPDGDGDPRDRADVILIGLASGFAAGGADPLGEALAAADRVGSTVVVPAGNDGATLTRPGSVGPLASSPTAITVGGLARDPVRRTVRLSVRVGPADAELPDLPLLGAEPPGDALPVVVLGEGGTLLPGDDPAHYRDAAGAPRGAGALVVVGRGGGTLQEKARLAAGAGARALAVWDESGPATFPVSAGDLDVPIPIVGLGRVQGRALADLLAQHPGAPVALDARASTVPGESVAGFSSWGPTVDGRAKPDVIAPALAVPAPLPGRGADGVARTGALTGTSAAAAHVAALAGRVRTDRPALGPRAVRALIVQGARPLDGVAVVRQGAGVAAPPDAPAVIAPAVIHVPPAGAAGADRRVPVSVSDVSGAGATYRVALAAGGRETPIGALAVPARGTARIAVDVPAASGDGRIVLRDAAGAQVAAAPVVAVRPPGPSPKALGTPRVRMAGGFAEVMVQVGELRREDGRVVNASLRGVRVLLVPASGGAPIAALGRRQDAAWPAGTYRLVLARRSADGAAVPEGLYRVRVVATAPDGTVLRTQSTRFRLR